MKKSYIITVIATLEIVLVSFLHNSEWWLFIGLLVLSTGLLSILGFSKFYLKSFVLFGLLGAGAEFLPVNFGAWMYDTNSVLGIPAYLPLLWGSASVVIIYLANKLSSYDK